MAGQRRGLTVFDRSMIEVRLRDDLGPRAIAREVGRSPGVMSDEINRHGGAGAYQARSAAALLRLGWSPEQISGRRWRMEAGVQQPSGLSVSHEAI